MSGDDGNGANSSGRSQKPWSRPTGTIGRIGGWGGSSSSNSRSGSGGRRIATLNDVGSGPAPSMGGGGGGHAHGGSDDDDDDDDGQGPEGESWFAGGERSGISVQNPDRQGAVPGGELVRDLLRRAAEAGPAPDEARAARGTAFFGGGHTLGSDEVESAYIPDPNAPPDAAEETAIRHLTFWRDGFTVEDGELMRYDNPEDARILAEINSGRAPPHVLNVLAGQPVELRVVKRLQDEYTPGPKARSAFAGAGHRLGSPVPGVSGAGASGSGSASAMPGTFPASGTVTAAAEREPESLSTRFEVDQTQPTTSVQIRLADGTRMVCRMNLTHTVQDIRNFINASRPENNARPYTIGTAFPNRTLEDSAQTIQAAGLVNSVVLQRWV